MIQVVDNYLIANEWDECLNYFKGDNWCFPAIDGPTGRTSVWRIFKPEIEEAIGSILYARLNKFNIEPKAIKRVGINGATALNESHLHRDGLSTDTSVVWFGSSQWDSAWDGCLNIHDEQNNVHVIEYVPNRAVLFPSHLLHIPNYPSVVNRLRISVGLHLEPASKWGYKYIKRM